MMPVSDLLTLMPYFFIFFLGDIEFYSYVAFDLAASAINLPLQQSVVPTTHCLHI